MTKKYVYFVSYAFFKDGEIGGGHMTVRMEEKISSDRSIMELIVQVKTVAKEANAHVVNFILLREEESE